MLARNLKFKRIKRIHCYVLLNDPLMLTKMTARLRDSLSNISEQFLFIFKQNFQDNDVSAINSLVVVKIGGKILKLNFTVF
jgi:hypothetical protein